MWSYLEIKAERNVKQIIDSECCRHDQLSVTSSIKIILQTTDSLVPAVRVQTTIQNYDCMKSLFGHAK